MSDRMELQPPVPFVGPPGTVIVSVKIEREGYKTVVARQPIDVGFLTYSTPAVIRDVFGHLANTAWNKQDSEGKLPGGST